MIRAKTPIAANIAPMMILVEFGSLVVAFGGVVKVNCQQGLISTPVARTGKVATHSIDIKSSPCIDYTDRVKPIREISLAKESMVEDLGW